MFRLQRYFTVTSLIAFVLIAILLGYFFRVLAFSDLIEASESKNEALTQTFSNFLWPEFEPFVAEAGNLDVETLRSHPRTQEFYDIIQNQTEGLSVVKIKVYDLEGLTVFSTQQAQIRDLKLDNAGYLSARDGVVASELTFRDSFSAFEQTIENRNVFSSYLPIYGPEGEIEGVFEVYDDVTPLVDHLNQTQRNIVLGVSLILAALYFALFFIIRRADGIIKQQYHDLQENEAALRQARDEALSATQVKSKLLANISHDMRTPVSAIIGLSEMLEIGFYGDISAKQKKTANDIIRNAGLLMEFISNLLNQAQIESGKLKLEIKPFSPAELVDDVQMQINVLAVAKGISLKTAVTEDVPDQLMGDRYWIRQIMLNLVNNAIKFTDEGEVILKAFCSENQFVIQVADTGLGIPPEAQRKIFEAFEQAHNTYVGSSEGSGLGLSIVKEMTTLMQGKVALESAVGEGSTFTITLPLLQVTDVKEGV